MLERGFLDIELLVAFSFDKFQYAICDPPDSLLLSFYLRDSLSFNHLLMMYAARDCYAFILSEIHWVLMCRLVLFTKFVEFGAIISSDFLLVLLCFFFLWSCLVHTLVYADGIPQVLFFSLHSLCLLLFSLKNLHWPLSKCMTLPVPWANDCWSL